MGVIGNFTVEFVSSKDKSLQKALFSDPPDNGPSNPVPLLVALHTWSGGYVQCTKYLPLAQRRGWACIAPDFRGPNNRPAACASALAIQDVLDAITFARSKTNIDPYRIYLVGASGGGHMALMMAAKAPEIWAGVSAWVPISDLTAWHHQTLNHPNHYDKMMELCCGGKPGTPATDKEYRTRSPLHILSRAKNVNLDIYTGIHDGHTGSVPVSQSLNAFNVLARAHRAPALQIPDEAIALIDRTEKIPASLAGQTAEAPELIRPPLFRRICKSVRLTIFEGGHDQDMNAALTWLSRQFKGRPADFSIQQSTKPSRRRQGKMSGVSH